MKQHPILSFLEALVGFLNFAFIVGIPITFVLIIVRMASSVTWSWLYAFAPIAIPLLCRFGIAIFALTLASIVKPFVKEPWQIILEKMDQEDKEREQK